jgi:hypothetical protein
LAAGHSPEFRRVVLPIKCQLTIEYKIVVKKNKRIDERRKKVEKAQAKRVNCINSVLNFLLSDNIIV